MFWFLTKKINGVCSCWRHCRLSCNEIVSELKYKPLPQLRISTWDSIQRRKFWFSKYRCVSTNQCKSNFQNPTVKIDTAAALWLNHAKIGQLVKCWLRNEASNEMPLIDTNLHIRVENSVSDSFCVTVCVDDDSWFSKLNDTKLQKKLEEFAKSFEKNC